LSSLVKSCVLGSEEQGGLFTPARAILMFLEQLQLPNQR